MSAGTSATLLMFSFRTLKCPIMYNLAQVNALKRDISEGIFEIKLICGCEFNEREIFRYPSLISIRNIVTGKQIGRAHV